MVMVATNMATDKDIIQMKHKTFLIAEIGQAHDGSLGIIQLETVQITVLVRS